MGDTDVLDDAETEVDIDAPRDNLLRSVTFRAEPSEDGLTLEGYGAVFGAATEIDSWEGTFTEEIARGAFKRSLGIKTPVLQFDHGQHPLIGSIPIGVIRSIREDEHGLKVRARLSDNWLVEPVRDAIRDGGITGMSFRFRVIADKWVKRNGMPHRTVTDVDLLEVGPVVWPAYAATSVGVRSRSVASALTDPDVRAEVARLLISGTDLRSPAESDAPAPSHASDAATAPASSHAEQPTKTARTRALLALD